MRKERESSRSRNYSGFAQGANWHWKSCFSSAQRSPRWAVFLSSSPWYWVSVAGYQINEGAQAMPRPPLDQDKITTDCSSDSTPG